VLLLLPPYYGSKPLSAEDARQLLLLERQLLQKSTAVPVFFTKETPELTAAVSHEYIYITSRGVQRWCHICLYEVQVVPVHDAPSKRLHANLGLETAAM
jgi:hypothetical protein